jgi:cyclic pyranopterin phosphate synthase
VGSGPARTFRIPGALGTVGFISLLGEHFCATCNRLRLTADGRLRPCLLKDDEVPVRPSLRSGPTTDDRRRTADSVIAQLIQEAVALKPSGHALTITGATLPQGQPHGLPLPKRTMCQIGG